MITCSTTLCVRYAEVGRSGMVSLATCMEWFELGASDLLRQAGLPQGSLEAQGIHFEVVEGGCRLPEKIGYDDLVRVETTLEDASRLRLTFRFRISREEAGKEIIAAEGFTTYAAAGSDGKPLCLPPDVAACLGCPQ